MIGTGIFLKPSEMAAVGGSVSIVYAAWIAGGLLTLFGALSFAELGAALPKAGGQYAYLREAYHPSVNNFSKAGSKRSHKRAASKGQH